MGQRGVCFCRKHCAGFWRRLLVDAVDYLVVFLAYIGLAITMLRLGPEASIAQGCLRQVLAAALWFGCFVLLKWSRFRTLGYRIGAVRLTNLQGGRPSLAAVAARSAFIILGPLNNLLDLAWLTGDPQRQALRDKFAHTYVVESQAQPCGDAPLLHEAYCLLGAIVVLPEVKLPRADPLLQSTGSVGV